MKHGIVAAVAGGAVVLGMLIDGLLRAEPWGAGFAIVIAVAVALASVVGVAAGHRIGTAAGACLLGALVSGAMVAVRDSPTLVLFDLLACALLLVLVPAALTDRRLGLSGPVEGTITAVAGSVDVVVGAALFLFRDVPWSRIRQARIGRPALAITRGVVLAVPPLLVFGALLASADAVFGRMLTMLLHVDLETLLSHLVLVGIGTWLALGWLARAGGERELVRISLELPESKKVGLTEVSIVLGMIDVLFAGFVVVQLRYFFGGADVIEAVPGLTRAEYARSGFFELVTVATLVVLLLLFADWVVVRTRRSIVVTRALAWAQILLVAVMLLSAWMRMQLYVEEFGLTELRLYTRAFMIWLGAALAWFCGTVLVDRRERFASGALGLGVVALLTLNLANPDALIVKVNVDRASRGGTFDASYLATLSADAVPAIAGAIDRLPADLAAELERGLARRDFRPADWRAWNVSRERAETILRSRGATRAAEP